MGGYAAASLLMVLHKQLGPQVNSLMFGAAVFLMIYAWLVHFEPFIAEWRLSGGYRAGVLYTGIAALATIIGAAIAETLLFGINTNRILLLATGVVFAAGCWAIYRFLPRLESLLGIAKIAELLDSRQLWCRQSWPVWSICQLVVSSDPAIRAYTLQRCDSGENL